MNRAILKIITLALLQSAFYCALSAHSKELAEDVSPTTSANQSNASSVATFSPRSDDYYNLGHSRSLREHQPRVVNSSDPLNYYRSANRISIYALLANGAAYEDKMVSVIGYLRRQRGCNGEQKHYVYPTRDAYEVNDLRESICLELNPLFKGSSLFEEGSPIEAVGIFAQKKDWYSGILRKGSMHLVKANGPYPQVGGQEGPVPVK